jgi:glyoxylase I family protein
MRKLGSINHLRLTVRDIPEAERFYSPLLAMLGYELIQRDARRLAWAVPGLTGHLQWFIVSLAAPEHRDRRHELTAPGLHHVAFNVDERETVDRFHRALVDQGAEILDVPAEYKYEPGYYAVFFRDPNAFKLEVVQVPQPTSVHVIRDLTPAADATEAER